MSFQSDLAELYTAFFNRAPDAAGLAYWVKELTDGNMSLESIANNWADKQPETEEKYPSSLSSDAFIEAVYNSIFGRSSDSDGAAYWKGELENGSLGRDVFIAALLNGAKANTSAQGQADAALVNNKAQVGVAFAEKGLNDLSLAVKVLGAVSSDTDTLKATLDLIKLVPAATSAQTSTLLALVSSTLDQVTQLIKTAPAEVKNLAAYLEAVVSNVSSGTNLTTLLTTISTKTTAALTDPAALANPTTQAGADVGAATPGTATPVFTVISTGEGAYTVGNSNGNVTVTLEDGKFVFTPATGSAVSINAASINHLVVNGIKLLPLSSVFQSEETTFASIPISGSGTLVLPFSSEENTAPAFLIALLANNYSIRVDFSGLKNIVGNITELTAAYTLASNDVVGLDKLNVTVNGPASISSLTLIDSKTTGNLVFTDIADTAAALLANNTYVKGSVGLIVTDSPTLSTLANIDAKTTGSISALSITDTALNLLSDVTYVKGDVNLVVTEEVTLTDLSTLASKTNGTLSFDSLTADVLTLANSTLEVASGKIYLAETNINEDGLISETLDVKQFTQLKSLSIQQAWYANLQDTTENLLQLTQGETRNTITLTLTGDDAGTVSVQQRSDLAKIIEYPDDQIWTYSLRDTAKNLLASKINDATVLADAQQITVTGSGPVTVAELEVLKSYGEQLTFSDSIVVRDTLDNLQAAELDPSYTYFVADSIAHIGAADEGETLLLANASGFYIVDSLDNIEAAGSESSPITSEPGFRGAIVADTLENLENSSVIGNASPLITGWTVTDFEGGNLDFIQSIIVATALNNNEFINQYSVSGVASNYNGAPDYFFKYASAFNLQATQGEDSLNGNITDGKITIAYTSGTQASELSFDSVTSSFNAVNSSFDTYSAFYGSQGNPDRDHIDLTAFNLDSSKNQSGEFQQNGATSLNDSGYAFIKGTYLDGQFVAAQYGSSEDTLVVWDADTSEEVNAVAIVLVGQSPNNAAGGIVTINPLP